MHPLAALEVPHDLRGVIFDVDDTITRGGILEAEAFSAMHALARTGLELVAVTGRPLGWSDLFARLWPVRVAIGENGAGWAWRDGQRMREGYFSNVEARRVERGLLDTIARRVAEEIPSAVLANDSRARRCDLAFDVGEARNASPEERAELEALIEREGARAVTSSVHCHAVPGPWDKASGVERAAREVLGAFDSAKWIFVGDSGNDVAAFHLFERSVGVANVCEHALETLPKFVTPSDRGRGFAELAAHVLAARPTNGLVA